ncbi:MAG TPA: exosortase E/protease, VPEID-CTERM system, partial [Vicinamibacterales bacterium]
MSRSVVESVTPAVTKAALLALLIGQLLYLTIRFDSQALDHAASPWLRVVAWSPQYLRLAITVIVVYMLLRATRGSTGNPAPHSIMSPGVRLGWVMLHLAALYGFTQISSRIFGAAIVATEAPWWVVAWVLVGAILLIAWALAYAGNWPTVLSEGRNRALAAGAISLGALAWLAGFLSESLWRTAANYTFSVSAFVLGLLYDDVVSRPERLILGTRRFRVNIAATCSGLEGVGLVLAFLGLYLWLFRRELRFPAALVLLPIGAVSNWLLNALRIVLLIVIGSSGWRDIALGGFHSQAGWLTFNFVALGFVAVVNRTGWFMKSRAGEQPSPRHDSTAEYLAPFVVVLAAGAMTSAFSSGLDWLYPLRVVAAGWVLWHFRGHYAHLGWSVSWRAVVIGIVTFGLWVVLAPTEARRPDGWPAALREVPLYSTAGWLLFRLIGSVIIAPLAEELAFRAYLTRRLIAPDVERVPLGAFTWPSFAISSLLFGLLHGSFWLGGVFAGMAFAVALYQRRALGDAVVAHATTNGLLAIYALATG